MYDGQMESSGRGFIQALIFLGEYVMAQGLAITIAKLPPQFDIDRFDI